MTIPEENAFAKNDLFPSWFANAIQRFLSTAAPAFQLTKQDATHVQVVADTDVNAAIISIAGKWRWIEATSSRAHPGGASGTWDIFAVAIANKIESGGIDATNRAFALRIVKSGETPTIEAGVVDIFRKVGSCQWSGSEITRVDQTVPLMATHAHRHAAGQSDAIAPADISAASTAQLEAAEKSMSDVLAPGILASPMGEGSVGDWHVGAISINGATGVMAITSASGGPHLAWIRSGAMLMRTVTPSALFTGITPPSLPAVGKYMTVGVHLVPGIFGSAATVAAVSGPENATEGGALVASPPLVAERVRICDILIKNTGGVYSVILLRDRRPWARGFHSRTGFGVKETGSTSQTLIFGSPIRAEIQQSAANMQSILTGVLKLSAAAQVNIWIAVNGIANVVAELVYTVAGSYPIYVQTSPIPAPVEGTNLFELFWSTTAGTIKLLNGEWRLSEIQMESTSNGSS